MPRTSAGRLALAVWALVLVLGVVYGPELRWAARALPLYATGRFPPLRERELAAEALRLADEQGDVEGALALMEASEAIDPNAFPFLQAELERRAGRTEAALAHYARATAVDPSDTAAWLRRAGLLQEEGRQQEAIDVLSEGLEALTVDLRLYRPRLDPGVAERFNAKAEDAYRERLRGVAALRAALARALRAQR